MTRSYEIDAVLSASSQTTSKGGHSTTITLLTDGGERLVLGLSGHAVAGLKIGATQPAGELIEGEAHRNFGTSPASPSPLRQRGANPFGT